ncbi:MAG: hypothetical protein HQM08_11645 [Candidatus Riflebacteria bacterium]|nr:hypothetical protein [Candidatus Riflebacteria bacterium]
MKFLKSPEVVSTLIIAISIFFAGPIFAQTASPTVISCEKIFDNASGYSPRDLYKYAYDAFSRGDSEGARLLALRIFIDGYRSTNLLNLLAAIEVKANRHLFAGEWLRKVLCINAEDGTAKKLLARLPPAPRPIPIQPGGLNEHFNTISKKVSQLMNRLTTPKIHFDSVFQEVARGQLYKALALAEEYEKKYPGIDGSSLSALCAYFIGRMKDAVELTEKGLAQDRHNPMFLTLQALISDTNAETSAPSRPWALYDMDRIDDALTAATEWNKSYPKSAEGFIVQARIAMDKGDFQAASDELEQASQRDPDNPKVELLKAGLFQGMKKIAEAGNAIGQAYRRGYNLPSVNLVSALYAISNNKIDEAKGIFSETVHYRPFIDRDAYPLYIQLAMILNEMKAAEAAIEEWKKRQPLNSQMCFLTAIFLHKAGNTATALQWAEKGAALYPSNAAGQQLLISLKNAMGKSPSARIPQNPEQGNSQPQSTNTGKRQPNPVSAYIKPPQTAQTQLPAAVSANAQAQTHTQTQVQTSAQTQTQTQTQTQAQAQTQTQTQAPVTQVSNAQSSSTDTSTTSSAETLTTVTGEKFTIEVGQGVTPEVVETMKQILTGVVQQLEKTFGFKLDPFNVKLVEASGMGSKVAVYDFDTNRLTLSVLFTEPETLKAFLNAERPDIDDSEKPAFNQAFPYHMLSAELSHLFIRQKVRNFGSTVNEYRWMHTGIAEIVGGQEAILKDILQTTQNLISSGTTKLQGVSEVNTSLSPSNHEPMKSITARAQAYLMVSFLFKKVPSLNEALTKGIKLLEAAGDGKPFKFALNESFGISESEFENGWKEAAYWCLRQGIPYEWQ